MEDGSRAETREVGLSDTDPVNQSLNTCFGYLPFSLQRFAGLERWHL